jgi:polysaccharide export outer membrane protein
MNMLIANLCAALTRSGRTLVAVVAALVVAACASPGYPPAPSDAGTTDYVYHIGPSDVVNVIVWRNPELSMSVPVRPDGKITMPLVDDLAALGKTPTELERDMEKALGKYIRDPVVTGRGHELRRPGQRAGARGRRGGEAAGPSVPPQHDRARRDDRRRRPDRLRGRQRGAHLPRRRRRQALQRAAARSRQAGDITANVEMKPGDILIIPQSWF